MEFVIKFHNKVTKGNAELSNYQFEIIKEMLK